MPKGLTFLPSLALAAMMALPLAAETEALCVDTVVARVNGDEITLGHVIATVCRPAAAISANRRRRPCIEFIVEQLIQQQLLAQQQDGAEQA